MDYKIVAKAISLWLGSVLADVIHPDQTYTVPDRSIFDNLFLVRDLLELGCRDGLLFTLLSLDQEKAFDRVDHGYLLSTLKVFGFGPQFVGFLRVLYTSAECLVKLNWTLTEPVSFGRGVWRLTGLVLREPELQLVLLAYADDVLLVIQDPGDLARVEACQAIYSAASSTRVNWVKSSGLAEFLNIFLNRESGEGPDFMNFLRKIELLSGWPVEKLPYNNPRICAFTFFRPGTVITKDSKASSKIYVINTGRLRVLKAMASSKPRLSLKSFRHWLCDKLLPKIFDGSWQRVDYDYIEVQELL
ncbi:unnamed protein product [Caretta caretta]